MITIDSSSLQWKRLSEEYPKEECGILFMVKSNNPSDKEDYEKDVRDHLFYGYVLKRTKVIFILLDITTAYPMSWKILKEYNDKDIYWFYRFELTHEYAQKYL